MSFPPTSIIVVEHLSPTFTVVMEPKRDASKDTIEICTGEVVESTSVNFLVYSDTQLFVEKESDITWKKVNEAFSAKWFQAYVKD